MTSEPYAELALAYFVLAFLSLLVFWALNRISYLEDRVRRLEREKAREVALAHLGRHEDYAPKASLPATVVSFPENRRAWIEKGYQIEQK